MFEKRCQQMNEKASHKCPFKMVYVHERRYSHRKTLLVAKEALGRNHYENMKIFSGNILIFFSFLLIRFILTRIRLETLAI